MKAKLKFDQAQAQAFLIAHVEKAVFGVLVVCFLWLLWSSFKVDSYDKKPDSLKTEALRVEKLVADSKPPSPLPGVAEVGDFSNRVIDSMVAIAPDSYPFNPLNRPYEDKKVRRKEPVFLAVRELNTAGGSGILAFGEGRVNKGDAGRGEMGPGDGMGPGMPGGPEGMGRGMEEMERRKGMGGPGMGGPGMGGPGMGGPGMGGPGMGGPGGRGKGKGGGLNGMGIGGGKTNKKTDKSQKKDKSEAPVVAKEDDIERRDLVPTSSAVYEGRHWVCVTGLVPVKLQSTEYHKVFQNAAHKSDELDEPRYDRFEVERALVTTRDQSVNELKWERLDMEALFEDMETWLDYPDKFVDKRYIDPAFSWYLPPLVSANHDPDRVRHPRIPLASKTASDAAQDATAKNRGAAGRGGAGGAGPGGRGMGGGTGPGGMGGGMGPGGMGSGGMGPGGMGPGGMGRDRDTMGRDAMGRGGAGPGGMGPGGMGPGGMGPGGMGGRDAMGRGTTGRSGAGKMGASRPSGSKNLVENKMFRFFDTTVEPGKIYRYRVRLELKNPNFGLRPEFLDKGHPELARDELKTTPWSEPSPGIFVPPAGSLLASDVVPASGGKESTAKVMVKTFDAEKGIEAVKLFDMRRGSLANQEGVETLVEVYSAAGGSKTETIDFETDAICLDMVGGEKLPMGCKAPGRVMIMRADGELSLLDQFADAASVDKEQRQLERMKKTGGGMKGPGNAQGGDGGKSDIWGIRPGDDGGKKGRRKK